MEDIKIVSEPVITRLIISDTNLISVESSTPMPNLFRRFWYWALLGWRWEKIESDSTKEQE